MAKTLACSRCGKPGHNSRSCGRAPKGHAHAAGEKKSPPKKPTGGGKRAKPARGATAVAEAAVNGHSTAARIRGLVQAVAVGKAAEAELAAIREALEA